MERNTTRFKGSPNESDVMHAVGFGSTSTSSGFHKVLDKLLDVACVNSLTCKLTKAELAVCEHYVRGMSYDAIAKTRNVSRETVKSQISSVLCKSACESRSQLIVLVVVLNQKLQVCQ